MRSNPRLNLERMEMTNPFHGIIVPMLTPLNVDESLDRPAVERMVDWLLTAGVHGLFILGSNGEGATLRPSIQTEMVRATLDAAAGRVPVLVGVLETATCRVIERMRDLALSGVAAFVVTTPLYYSSWLQESDLYAHFRAIADASEKPLLLYNIPQMTGRALSVDLVLRLGQRSEVVGLKDSSGNWEAFEAIVTSRPSKQFALLQGQQSLSVRSLLIGADGLIPGYANVYPKLLIDLLNATQNRDMEKAVACQVRLDELLRIRGRAVLHANKTIAKAFGLMDDHLTAPLPRLTLDEAAQFLRESVAAGLPLRLAENGSHVD
jgi:4-hydroxy-tetrahydrodipicolinate synthase